jgi:hypothetical protein
MLHQRTMKLETTVTLLTTGERMNAHLMGRPGKSDVYAAKATGAAGMLMVWKGLPLSTIHTVDDAERTWKFLMDGCLRTTEETNSFPVLDERSRVYLRRMPSLLEAYEEIEKRMQAK